ncbi:MAG: FAD-dependent oxidoreductase [Rhodospirillales bacterium]|nr:FAD-dependent oxidoreductase [Rhodospirillales bacterium]
MTLTESDADPALLPGAARYPSVFRPIELGPVRLRNRIFVPAHTTNFGEDNLPSERHLAYHRARARGGVGMIVFEGIRVHPSSLGRRQGVNGYDPACISRFAAIARAVQQDGAKLFGQIIHLGRHIDGNYARMAAWSASAVPWTPLAAPPHPMTVAEIGQVVAAHADVARHLMEAGLDGVEVTLAHGHLLQQFLSPAVNRRSDAYGGPVENRMRMALEAVAAVRAAVGDAIAVGVRISADEFLEGGLTLADMQDVIVRLAGAVKLDFVNVSHSAYHGSATISTQMADMAFEPDAFRHLPRGIATALGGSVPVFAVCRFRTLAEAETMLQDGEIAMVGMARAHIADTALVRKAAEGREDATRPCIACNQGCTGFLAQSLPITCLSNAAMGRETEWPLPAPAVLGMRQAVAVIGGGPAGMEAALVAAERGHAVTLWEASTETGGALRHSLAMPKRRDFGLLLDYQRRAVERAGVTLRLGERADATSVAGFDAVVVATGARPAAAALPGGGTPLTMEAALADPDALGAHVAVQDLLGSWAMTGLIEFLADSGRQVTVIAPTGTPGWQMSIYSSFAWRKRLRDRRVRILGLRSVQSFADGALVLQDASTGDTECLEGVDSLIAPAVGIPNDALVPVLSGNAARPVLPVGDCVAARSALEAIFEGHQAGRTL